MEEVEDGGGGGLSWMDGWMEDGGDDGGRRALPQRRGKGRCSPLSRRWENQMWGEVWAGGPALGCREGGKQPGPMALCWAMGAGRRRGVQISPATGVGGVGGVPAVRGESAEKNTAGRDL